MTDSSDGESFVRRFNNLLEEERTSEVIKKSDCFIKFCHNYDLTKNERVCIDDLKIDCNSEKFKSSLRIPKATIVEVNIANDNTLKFLFAYKGKQISTEIFITTEMLSTNRVEYLKRAKLAQAKNKQHADSAMISKPCANEKQDQQRESINNKDISALEAKVEHLITQISQLNALLLNEKEENNRLKQKIATLCKAKKKQDQDNPAGNATRKSLDIY